MVCVLAGKGRVDLNYVRIVLGRSVNLHLRDGSVIVNVRLVEARRGELTTFRYHVAPKRGLMGHFPEGRGPDTAS
jgi:hypothetical protein